MEYRKRSRSNPINDTDSDNENITINTNYMHNNKKRYICCRFIIWIYKKIICNSYRINKTYKLPV